MTETELKKQVLKEHLLALRKALVISVAAIAVFFLIAFYFFGEQIMAFFLIPLQTRGIDANTLAPAEGIISTLKISLIAGIVAAMPVIMWQLWAFVSPALYPEEKRLFIILFIVAFLLFLIGIIFGVLYVFPLMLDLFQESSRIFKVNWSVQNYYSTTLGFIIPFGLVFELPVAIYMATRKGWVSYQALAKNRKFVILGIAVVAAILTPPEVITQIMLMLPMVLLYEVSVQISRFVKPKKQQEEEESAAAA